ncbi:hypothetical protein L1987_70940 [Smallanthus sonchifolius]|uniref:Uncharacterized protein n=1 Tax=Smallanthus sonchifolius TaxID=185202 RepID=A0ACB9AR24_9ASTR|nr:hypothetical protein L1987_70940 [Smallanthus sonchifolius]
MKTVGSAMVRGRLPDGKSMIRKGKSLKENSRRMSLAKRMKRARCFACKGCGHVVKICPNKSICKSPVKINENKTENKEYIVKDTDLFGWDKICENGEQLDHLDESDLENKRQSKESYLKGYFKHLDEDMVEFLDLLIHEKLVIERKEDFEKGFVKMVKWFYEDYLESGIEKDVPSVIEGQEINMLDLYMVVNRMGGSTKVSRNNKWVEVVSKLGFPGYFDEKLRVCYMKYFDLIDCYYSTIIGNKNLFGDQDQVDEVLVQEKVKDVQEEDKWEDWKWKQGAVNAKRDYPLTCSGSTIFAGLKNPQDEGKTESEPSIEEYYEVGHDAAMLGSEEIKMHIGYEGNKDDSSDDDLVIILN